MKLLTRIFSVQQINDLRGLILPGSLPLGGLLLSGLSTSLRHSLIAACFVFGALALLNLDRLRMLWLVLGGLFYFGISVLNLFQINKTLRAPSNIELTNRAFVSSFLMTTVSALILALTPWFIGASLSAYAELLVTFIVIAYCLIFAVMHIVFPISALSFGLINSVSVSAYWINTHYDFKWPMALLILVIVGFTFVVSLNFGQILRRALTLQIERDEARVRAESAALGLEEALASLKRISLEKLRFFAAASHDLRQPLSAISLFIGVLQRKLRRKVGEDPEIRDLIDKLDRNLASLDDIVGSMSDISALETGDFAPRAEVFDLRAMVQTICLEFEGQCENNGTSLDLDLPQIYLFSDSRMLTRVIRNAIDNAVKYAGQRDVKISVLTEPTGVHLSIRDFGPGIPDEMRGQVTEDYVQLDNPERDRKKGFGLGLSIAKRMAQALGSRIELRQPMGGGSSSSLRSAL